jgi:hypothetical protein
MLFQKFQVRQPANPAKAAKDDTSFSGFSSYSTVVHVTFSGKDRGRSISSARAGEDEAERTGVATTKIAPSVA